MIEHLRQWLREWLGVAHPATKLSGAMYKELRHARGELMDARRKAAEVIEIASEHRRSLTLDAERLMEANSAALTTVLSGASEDMERLMRRQNMANSIATADYENTLHAIGQLTIKFDAYAKALGVVIQPGPEVGDEPAIAFICEAGERVLAERLLAADIELAEMRKELAQMRKTSALATGTLRRIEEIEREAKLRTRP